MRVAGISLVVNTVATLLLVDRYGAVGAAWGTIIGGLVATCCYLLAAVTKQEVLATFLLAARVAIAATGMGCVVYFVRDQSWLSLILVSIAVYTPLLFVVGAIRVEDVRFFRNTFLLKAA